MDERLRRMARNEARFRAMNEHTVDAVDRFHGGDAEQVEIMCECSSTTCESMLVVARDTYAQVRSHEARFLVAPGHEAPLVETVVGSGEGHLVVQKDQEAVAEVEATNQ